MDEKDMRACFHETQLNELVVYFMEIQPPSPTHHWSSLVMDDEVRRKTAPAI
jgi:hypothetical protein